MKHPAHHLSLAARRVLDNISIGVSTRTAKPHTKQVLLDSGLAMFDESENLVLTETGRTRVEAWRASRFWVGARPEGDSQ